MNHGSTPGVLDRVPSPESAPAQLFVRPDHAEREAERQEDPREHRPAPHRAQPRIVQVAGDERGHAERKRNRHPHEADVQRRRVDDHVEVLQQRVQPVAVRRHLRQVRVERVVVDDHEEQKEHLHPADHRDDVGNQLAMAVAIHVHGQAAEARQQEHPEHDRAVEPAPVGRDLEEQRLERIGIARHVPDGEIVGDEGMDHQHRRHHHQRRHHVERADAAFDEPPRPAPRAGHRHGGRVAADDEGREENGVTQCGHMGL